MESAEHLLRVLNLKNRGIQVLLWESKTDLVRALLVLKAALDGFPDVPVLLPSNQVALQRFSIELYENVDQSAPIPRRFLLVPQASAESVGAWLNGWRQRLAASPGTVVVIRRADYAALCRRAPDLMSFAHSDVHDATGLLPLLDCNAVGRLPDRLPSAWNEELHALPGEIPAPEDIADWNEQLKRHAG
ncbi:MAG TPA: hypothetical protein VNH11_24050 [Pirellulales bacterium]|nr:hypothetical protein [Pirellulales bacterium]